MSNPKLSQRDKDNLTDQIKDKMVDTICSRIMDESASDSQLISGVLKKNLGDKINEILGNPSNEAKISDTIFQAINSSLRHTVKGPLLLYSILNNKESFNQTKVLITKIFTNVYNNSNNKSQSEFVKNLLTKLSDPPYRIWFNQQVEQTTGGKRRKTMRSRKKKKSRTYRHRQTGGDFRGKLARGMGFTGADAAEQARDEAKKNKPVGKSFGIKAALGLRSAEDEAAHNEKYEKQKAERAEEGKRQMQEGLDRMMGRKTGDDESNDDKEGTEGEAEETGDGEEGASEENPEDGENAEEEEEGAGDEEEGAADEGAGSFSGSTGQVAEELFKEYNEELLNRLIKRLDETEYEMLERLLNATYQYSRDNSNVILDSIKNAIYDTAKINDILPESTNILITQALYASSINVQRAIENTYMEFRKEEIEKGIPSAQVKFNPKLDSFINDFLQKLTISIKEQINLST